MRTEKQIGLRTARVMKGLTESKLGMDIPKRTFNAWVALTRTIRAADDLIDQEENSLARRLIYMKGVGFLSGERQELGIDNKVLVQEISDLKVHFNSLSTEQKASFLRNLKTVLRLGEIMRTTRSASRLARLSMMEGEAAARMYVSFLPENFYDLDRFGDYLKYLSRWGRGANAYDSLVDLSTDFREGRTLVRPTLRNMADFTRVTLLNTLHVAAHSNPRIIRGLLTGASTVAKDRKGDSDIHFSAQK